MGFAVNLHSIFNSELIRGGQKLSNRQTVFFTSVDPVNKEHKDPEENNLNAPRFAWYKQKYGRHIRNTVYSVDIKLGSKERIEVLSNKIERNHPLQYTPSLLYPEGSYEEIWRSHIRESICVTSTSSEDFLEK